MTTLNVSLPDHVARLLEARAARDGFRDPSQYVEALIRQDLQREGNRALEAMLQEGIDSGPAEDMTADDWAELRQALIDAHGQRKQP